MGADGACSHDSSIAVRHWWKAMPKLIAGSWEAAATTNLFVNKYKLAHTQAVDRCAHPPARQIATGKLNDRSVQIFQAVGEETFILLITCKTPDPVMV